MILAIFLENRAPPSNEGSKIVSMVVFWYHGLYATQKHLRSSISVNTQALVPFLKAKIVDFGLFLAQIMHRQKEAFLVEKAIFRQKQHDFYFEN